MNPLYAAVAERAHGRCEYCNAPEEVFNFAFEVEHIRPVSSGGGHEPENLALACHSCNRYKSDYTHSIDEATNQVVPLFNPRRDVWTEHFRVEKLTAEIAGISATGRVTVARLQMNRPRHVIARLRWMQFGVFP